MNLTLKTFTWLDHLVYYSHCKAPAPPAHHTQVRNGALEIYFINHVLLLYYYYYDPEMARVCVTHTMSDSGCAPALLVGLLKEAVVASCPTCGLLLFHGV